MRLSLLILALTCLMASGSHAQSIPNFRKSFLVSHLKPSNMAMLHRPGAPKHNAISRIICFKYKCRMVVGWHQTQQRNKFKRYKKGPGIPRLKYLKTDTLKRIENEIKLPVRDSIPSTVVAPARRDSTITFVFDDVLFDRNSSVLKREFMDQLDTLSTHLRKYSDYEIRITGHTDNSGTEKDNVKLSKHRAESVATYLASTGIDPELITTEGMGSKVPVQSNDTIEGRKKNRRVEILLTLSRR